MHFTRALRIARELNWTPAQNGRLDWVRGGDRENRGLKTSLEKSEFPFPVSPETENSHWFKGGKSAITFTTADHGCILVRFVTCSSGHY